MTANSDSSVARHDLRGPTESWGVRAPPRRHGSPKCGWLAAVSDFASRYRAAFRMHLPVAIGCIFRISGQYGVSFVARDDIRFGSLKEDRGWYFVEYTPPIVNYRFSSIQLSIVEERSAQDVATAMEGEAGEWLTRYAVPVMVTAYSLDETTIQLHGVRPINHLIAWVERPGEPPVLRWELVENEVLPDDALDPAFLKAVFADVPSRMRAEIQADAAKYLFERKVGWWLVGAWSVVGPLGFVIAEYSSELLGLVVLFYAFWKAGVQLLRLKGWLPKSARQREKEAMDARMRHHHFHCERNPKAFERLKAENFRRDAVARTKAEAVALKAHADKVPTHD